MTCLTASVATDVAGDRIAAGCVAEMPRGCGRTVGETVWGARAATKTALGLGTTVKAGDGFMGRLGGGASQIKASAALDGLLVGIAARIQDFLSKIRSQAASKHKKEVIVVLWGVHLSSDGMKCCEIRLELTMLHGHRTQFCVELVAMCIATETSSELFCKCGDVDHGVPSFIKPKTLSVATKGSSSPKEKLAFGSPECGELGVNFTQPM